MLENNSLTDRLPICLLYVEDEESIRIPMLEMLKRRIDRIIVAKDGQEGLESFINFGADVVLSDLKMPNMNGLQMISEIKKIAPDTKTVIVSAYSDTEFFQHALELGVDGFLLKPVQRAQLINTVTRVSESILSLKKARVNEEMFLSLASSASDAILMIGNNGLISFWNPAAEKIFGRSSQEVYDQPFTLVFAPESLPNDWPSDYKGMPDFIRNNPASASFFELLGIRSSGEQFPTEVSISPVHIDDYWHATFIVRDISERKQREADLIKARENAEEASMARQRFLSVMSHEIRTPLNGIIGTANLLAQEDPREDQKEYLETLVFSGNHLLSLINDILDFSKIEANKIEFERLDFNLKELVSGVLKIFDYKAADKGISLTAELDTQIPTFLKGDTVRLNQILTNLIGNAIKFTEKGEVKVLVKTKNLSESSITCKFEIIDTGIGIPQDKIHTIFDLFSQADTNTTRKFGGTGLGLAITQKLIELQRGKINVQSEVGHGSNFTFELTFNRSSKKIEPNSTTVDNLKSLEGMKVLLVEDNKINQMIATKFLMRWNAQVTLAENGLEALERVQQQKHDIVLMDLQMPLMDGYEAAAQIRKLDGIHYQKIPIIALTASALIEVKEGITRAGMNDIVSKPFIPDELNNKIFEYVNKS
jgi:PAS domain S-box-containing protein